LHDEPDLFAAEAARGPALRPGPRIGPDERLSATLALATIVFGVIILGVGFTLDDPAPVLPTLDIILTRTRTDEAPKDADFLAQATNRGGGDRDRSQRPREAQLSDVPKPEPGIAPEPMTAQAPPPAPTYQERLLTTTGATDRRTPAPEDRDQPALPLPSGAELQQQSLEAARMIAELARERELYAKRPVRKFISASTREYEFAAYMQAWVEKVERVGNLNFPDEVRRRGLEGRLVMTVVVRRDGSVGDITLTTPSGEKLLDESAIRTVRLAEPFAPLPKTREGVDELYITRTWNYVSGGVSTE
jgi:protein TonB